MATDRAIVFYYRLHRIFVSVFTTFVNRCNLLLSGARLGRGFGSCGLIHIRNYAHRNGIRIGNDVYINSCMMANPIGGDTKAIIFVGKCGRIDIKDGVKMSNVTLFSVNGITIGENTLLGGGTKVYDTDFHSCSPIDRLNGNVNVPSAEVSIGARCFIGSNVFVLKGVHIGDDAVVGAGSVVTKDIPPGQIWAGNPAKHIKDVSMV